MESMKNIGAGTPDDPRGGIVNGKDLDAMSALELAEELERIWGKMDEDTYDQEVIDAYLDALDRKAPMPEYPDAKTAYQLFRDATHIAAGKKTKRRGRRRILQVALAAVIAVSVVLGAMITAQAAGVDVFGSIARWTKEIFCFGEERAKNVNDEPNENDHENDASVASNHSREVSDFQKTLDAYGISEVREPSWVPDGYRLEKVTVTDQQNFGFFAISASYRADRDKFIVVKVAQNKQFTSEQVQKGDGDIESFQLNGMDMYVIKNENNCTITWTSEKYEVQIYGAAEERITAMAESMLT